MQSRKSIIELTNWKLNFIDSLNNIFKDKDLLCNSEDYLPSQNERTHTQDWIHRILTKSKNSKYFAITHNNKLAGGINISFKENLWNINAEISYFVAKEYRNKGVVTKAIELVTGFVFTNYESIQRIIALTVEDNPASQKPLVKNNYKLEYTLENYLLQNEKLKNCCIYSMQKKDYLQ